GITMISITDIAKKAGVSSSMVSRVLNGKRYVNPEKREQILKLIRQTGYVPNRSARSIAMERSFTIAIVIPDTFNMFQRQLFSIIERHLVSFGYHIIFFLVKWGVTSEKECLTRLMGEKLDGVIMLHEVKLPEFYKYLESIKLPVISTMCNYNKIPTIKVDDKQAAYEGMEHLIGLGHRGIAMICGNGFSFGAKRAEGYFKALSEHGIARDENRLVYVPQYTPEAGMYGMRELLLRSRDFSAVFACSDELALGAMRTLQDENYRIPQDISLIGFDDIDTSSYLFPRLTTIRQPIQEIGEQSALYLHRIINGQDSRDLEQIIPHRLIVRESTARLRSPS
ncbi:MAG: LacI family transcriptional regulator, partial [Spirochaetaceae bacterium]|nr:LacI family transcriptional regulator [Spirochaetaceae bacterium]